MFDEKIRNSPNKTLALNDEPSRFNPTSSSCARTRKEMSHFNLRETLEVYISPIDLNEDWQYVWNRLGREVKLDADPGVVQRKEVLLRQYFLSDRSFLGSEALLFMDRSYEGATLLTGDETDALEAMSSAQSWQQQMNLIARVSWDSMGLRSFFQLTDSEIDMRFLVDLSTAWWSPKHGHLFQSMYRNLYEIGLPSLDMKAITLRTFISRRVIKTYGSIICPLSKPDLDAAVTS